MAKLISGCPFYSKDCFSRLLRSCLIPDFMSGNVSLELMVREDLCFM